MTPEADNPGTPTPKPHVLFRIWNKQWGRYFDDPDAWGNPKHLEDHLFVGPTGRVFWSQHDGVKELEEAEVHWTTPQVPEDHVTSSVIRRLLFILCKARMFVNGYCSENVYPEVIEAITRGQDFLGIPRTEPQPFTPYRDSDTTLEQELGEWLDIARPADGRITSRETPTESLIRRARHALFLQRRGLQTTQETQQ